MVPAGVLGVVVTASTGKANAALRGTQAQFRATAATANTSSASTAKAWKRAGGAVALAGVAVAGVSSKMAIDFDRGMRNVNSIAQLSEKRFESLRGKVLDLAGPTAQAPQTLAEGMYDLVSSGFNASESLTVLKSSAKAATTGLTEAATSTKVVAAVLNAYRQPADKAKKVSDVLFRTVDRGVITFEDLAQNIGDTLPFASTLGVKLYEVGAAVSTMTKQGLGAPETMTRIRNVLQTLIKPGEELESTFKSLGMSGEEMIKRFGFQETLERLIQTTDGSKEAVAKLFPNIRALGGVLALTGKNAQSASQDLTGLKDSSGAMSRALSQQSKSVSFQWQQFKAEASATAIEIGTNFLPIFIAVIHTLADLGSIFVDVIGAMPTPLLAAAAAAIATGLAFKTLSAIAASSLVVSMAGAVSGFVAFVRVAAQAVASMGLLRGGMAALSLAFATNPIGVVALSVGALAAGVYGLTKVLGGGSEEAKKFSKRHWILKQSSENLTESLKRQKEAVGALDSSEKKAARSKDKQRDATRGVNRAESRLAALRKEYPDDARIVLDAERDLIRARHREERATKDAARAERIHGLNINAAKNYLSSAASTETKHIGNLKDQRKQLVRVISASNKKGLSDREVIRKTNKLDKVTRELRDTERKRQKTYQLAADKIGPDYAKNLKEITEGTGHATKNTARMGRALQRNAIPFLREGERRTDLYTDEVIGLSVGLRNRFLPALEKATGTTKSAGKTMDKTRKSYKNFEKTGGKAVQVVGLKTSSFLDALGAPPPPGLRVKKREGGFMVGGHGSGDSVPVNLMLEPGETGFILNKHATNAINTLKEANSRWPRSRMQRGGMVDPAGPGTGIVNKAIAGIVGKWSQQYDAAINYGYDPGGGHVSPGHNVTGTATDTGPAKGWAGAPLALFERGLRAIEGQVDQILYGTAGIGTPFPNHGRGNHAHIEWGFNPGGISGGGMQIKRIVILGPDGPLKYGLQAAADEMRDEANKHIRKQFAKFGEGAETGIKGAGGMYSVNEMSQLWKRAGGPSSQAHVAGAVGMAESRGDPNARNPSGASGLWQILGQVVPGNIFDPFVNAKNAVSKYKSAGGWSPWVAYTNGAYRQFMKSGGPVGVAKHLFKRMRRGLKGIEKQDERIDIAERLAGLAISPAGEELSVDEIQKQLGLQQKLMKQLKDVNRQSRRGMRSAQRGLKQIDHDRTVKNLQKRIRTENKKKKPNKDAIERWAKKMDKEREDQRKDRDQLREWLREFKTTRTEMQGVTGGGGRIFDTKIAIEELKAAGFGGAGVGGISLAQLLAFAEATRYGAFKTELPSFHDGGVVKAGRAGQTEVPIMAQRDEGIFTPQQMAAMSDYYGGRGDVYVTFADGMGWLRQFMTIEMDKRDGKTAVVYRSRASSARTAA